MDKNSKRLSMQTGSLHVIIITVLFVALMATLGIVFYQNFIDKKPVAVQTDSQTEDTSVTKRVAFESDIYKFSHPQDWKVETKEVEGSKSNGTTTVVSNSKKTVEAILTIHEQDPNMPCDTSDGLKVSYYKVQTTPVSGLADVPVYLTETINDSPGGGYVYKIGLVPDSGATHAAVGDSHCNVKDVGIVSTAIVESDKLIKPTIIAMINFPKLQSKEGVAIKSMKEVKDLLDTEDYKIATEILKSTRRE